MADDWYLIAFSWWQIVDKLLEVFGKSNGSTGW